MPKEQIEEYIEGIYDIAGKDGTAKTTEVAKRLQNNPASVTEVFQNMAKNGLVKYEPYKGVSLTETGIEVAIKIKRKHRLLEVFLSEILHIDPNKVHEEACRMEHCISDEVGDAICRLLNAPARCPDGKLIYPCKKEIDTCVECEMATHIKDAFDISTEYITDNRPQTMSKGNHSILTWWPKSHSETFGSWAYSRDGGYLKEKNALRWTY